MIWVWRVESKEKVLGVIVNWATASVLRCSTRLVRFKVPELKLVISIEFEGSTPTPTLPRPSELGSADTFICSALLVSNLPAPIPVTEAWTSRPLLSKSVMAGLAEFTNALLTRAGVRPEVFCFTSAAAPAAIGAAKLVPSAAVKPEGLYMSPFGSNDWVAMYRSVPTASKSGLTLKLPIPGP